MSSPEFQVPKWIQIKNIVPATVFTLATLKPVIFLPGKHQNTHVTPHPLFVTQAVHKQRFVLTHKLR